MIKGSVLQVWESILSLSQYRGKVKPPNPATIGIDFVFLQSRHMMLSCVALEERVEALTTIPGVRTSCETFSACNSLMENRLADDLSVTWQSGASGR